MRRASFLFTLLILLFPVVSSSQRLSVDELAITVAGTSREVAFTNKEAGYFYTESGGEHRTGWQGWHIMSTTMMSDYRLFAGGDAVPRTEVRRAIVRPHQLQREYKNGLIERVTMLDSVDALVVELENIRRATVRFVPIFGDAGRADDFVVKRVDGVLLVARRSHLHRTPKDNYPVWIAFDAAPGNSFMSWGTDSLALPFGFGPVRLLLRPWHQGVSVILAAADDESSAVRLVHDIARSYPARIASRKARMELVINQALLRCDDARYERALAWAKLSVDALLMHQLKKGIFAGLPWFDNYWGRDSYISLAGATLVTGHFAEAKEILRSFAQWQDTSAQSRTYGRIPNLVTVNSIAYNTADGTPWFTVASLDYVLSSGDTAFAREIYPAVRLAIEASLERNTDEHRFLTHGDAETWMDAVGTDGPWSPRGNRANDIQNLWYNQLMAGTALAWFSGDSGMGRRWSTIADTVRQNFNALFVDRDSVRVADRLRPDGSADFQYRPNQFFTLDLIDDPATAAHVFVNATRRLVYPYGVASLWQEDPDFHPYHHYEQAYVQDAAYHNGIVWVWLAGRWIDAATAYGLQDTAFIVTRAMTDQILERGAVGTLSELLDAAPRPGEAAPQLSGTFSQAWSLAEYLRTAYRSYCGVSVDAVQRRISLRPRLPENIQRMDVDIPIGSLAARARYSLHHGDGTVTVSLPASAPPWVIVLQTLDSAGVTADYATVRGGTDVVFTINPSGVEVLNNGVHETATRRIAVKDGTEGILRSARLATPFVRPDLKALRPASHRLLSHDEIKRRGEGAVLLCSQSDPAGDDTGTGGYRYPLNPALKPGSLDIREFSVSADSHNVHFSLAFTRLSNPGWHPEYGFQLTMAAIAIHRDGHAGSGARWIGRNALYPLDSTHAFERIIYVGGGLRIEDGSGTVLAEYRPAAGDEKDPLGRIETNSVTFSIPVELLGAPSKEWSYTIVVGAQDDHGGAGIGEFRAVGREAGEWIGGGKSRPDDPNVYDVLFAPMK